MKTFEMTPNFWKLKPVIFNENDAPDWLTGEKTVKGSTMDNRWFWKDHVLTLEVGESVETDFQVIKRIS